MKKMNKEDKKFCPKLNGECVAEKCGFYEEKLSRCSIPLFASNLWRLSVAIEKLSVK